MPRSNTALVSFSFILSFALAVGTIGTDQAGRAAGSAELQRIDRTVTGEPSTSGPSS